MFDHAMGKVGHSLMNTIAMGITYEGWSDDFSYTEIKDRFFNIRSQLQEMIGDVTKLSIKDLRSLGFSKWDDESNIYLIPLWAYEIVPSGVELTCIDGTKVVKGIDEIDLDIRFGCIAYGLEVPENEAV